MDGIQNFLQEHLAKCLGLSTKASYQFFDLAGHRDIL